MADEHDLFPLETERLQREEAERKLNLWGEGFKPPSGAGGPGGLFGLPLWIGLMLFLGALVYPLPGIVVVATLFLFEKIAQLFHLSGVLALVVTYVPGIVMLWIAVRWDIRLAVRSKLYWIFRHLVRMVLFALLLMYVSTQDAIGRQSWTLMFPLFFQSSERMVVSAVLLVLLHLQLISENGFVKQLWHTGQEVVGLRPNDL